jgi:acyl carrier protein
MDIESVIAEHLNTLLTERDITLQEPLSEATVLLATGLDSLAFAIMVVRLESALGYDPFILMEEPVYPRTYGELVEIYERFGDHRR